MCLEASTVCGSPESILIVPEVKAGVHPEAALPHPGALLAPSINSLSV